MFQAQPPTGPGAPLLVVALLGGLLTAGCVAPDDATPPYRPSAAGIGFEHSALTNAPCSVHMNDAWHRLRGEGLALVSEVWIRESATTVDRWRGEVDMVWGDWPGTDPSIMGDRPGGPPVDDGAYKRWTSKLGEAHQVSDELRLEWDADEFDRSGTYRGTLTVMLTKQTYGADGHWKTVCRESGDAKVTVNFKE